ncbi:MAG TPA: HAMP domain-containing histidine kinase, partial [Sediminispirochaeta sp.]|nr:HAMP domain-containing histidine kinase [Sediminispirochaeta sp.]
RQIYLRKTSIDRLRIIKAQKEELEKMTRNRDRVDQILRHDLKSPLNGIIGTAKLLLNGDIEEGRDELLSMIEQSGFKILHMIDNSLDQYQMEDGTYHLRVEPVDIVKVLEELRGEFASQLTLKELSLDYVFPPDISGQESIVEGEELKLASMLSNLLKNAVEAAPRGSSVQVTLTVDRAQDRVNMDIHNMGSIPEEIRTNFFQRYITSGKQHGTGLGTYSAKLIVDVHGGEISFASSEEEGTHLYISLPRRQSPELPSGDTVRKKITPNIA